MSRDVVIENWLASMDKSELIAQCFFWHDMALEHDHMYNIVNAENAKLRKLAEDLHTLAYNVLPERKSDYITICSVESCIDYYSKTMPLIEQRMCKLGVKVTK